MTFTQLNFFGLRVSVGTPWESLAAELRHSYHYFLTRGGPNPIHTQTEGDRFRVLHQDEPAPRWGPSLRLWGTRLYWGRGGERRVCFFGSVWVAYHYKEGWAKVWGQDPKTIFEAIYLLLHSYVGEAMDRKGLHRIHGLGVSTKDRGAIFLGASGTGKSTLAMDLLRETDLGLLSDDMPLVDGHGTVHPFPQRIALKEAPPVESRFVRPFLRAKYSPKFVVSAEYFGARVGGARKLSRLVVTRRLGAASPTLRRLSSRELFVPLLKWLVVGWETPQIWQLFVRGDLLAKGGILFRRVRTAWALGTGCEGYALELGTDRRANWELARSIGEGAPCV